MCINFIVLLKYVCKDVCVCIYGIFGFGMEIRKNLFSMCNCIYICLLFFLLFDLIFLYVVSILII